MENNSLKYIAYNINNILEEKKFTVTRYNDYDNRIVFLVIDYGMLGTIRISEKGSGVNKNCYYKYNIEKGFPKYIRRRLKTENGFKYEYYIPFSDYLKVIKLVEKDYKCKVEAYSLEKYKNKVIEKSNNYKNDLKSYSC